MISAIDFGCFEVRSAWRDPANPNQLVFTSERSEYVVLPDEQVFAEAVAGSEVTHAVCEDSLVVFGNQAHDVRWLSRKPCAPLFTDGQVPTQDAPARQILNLLTKGLLPQSVQGTGTCVMTVPGGPQKSRSGEFLTRLIRMNGFIPQVCSVSEAVNLSCGQESGFTSVTICMGTESTEISVSRFGTILASETLNVGSNWIDTELARQLKMQIWDDGGECYLDLEAVREWKHDTRLHLRKSVGERERTLSRLYGVVLDRFARSVRSLIQSPGVASFLGETRFPVICCGGPTLIGGFAGALTERFVEQETANRILAIRVIETPGQAVVRGLLIHGELEARRAIPVQYAA